MPNNYGEGDRRDAQDDSQLLQQMAVKQAVIANDISHMVDWTKTHTIEDENRHNDNLKKFDKIDKSLTFQNKVIYGALGIVAFIELIVKFIK